MVPREVQEKWLNWAKQEIGGDNERFEAAALAAITALSQGKTQDEIVGAAHQAAHEWDQNAELEQWQRWAVQNIGGPQQRIEQAMQAIKTAVAQGKGEGDIVAVARQAAGIMALPKRTLNSQGLELQIATNYFGPFLLTALLFPLMKEEEGSRIVTLSSTAARSARLEFDNLQFERRYVPHGGAYAQSKLADLIFAFELHRRLSAANSCIASIATHPGWALTDLGRSVGRGSRVLTKLARPLYQSAEAGSLPLLFAATSPNARKGGYYGPDGRNEAKENPTAAFEPVITKDETVGRRLWDESERVTDMQFVVSAPSVSTHDRHCVGDARQPTSRAE